jgi:hypothetical protein
LVVASWKLYVVGYWPSSIFSYLGDSASSIMWGGEVYSPNHVQTSTQMGSGHFIRKVSERPAILGTSKWWVRPTFSNHQVVWSC